MTYNVRAGTELRMRSQNPLDEPADEKNQADYIWRIISHSLDGICEHYFHPPDCVKPQTQFASLLTFHRIAPAMWDVYQTELARRNLPQLKITFL